MCMCVYIYVNICICVCACAYVYVFSNPTINVLYVFLSFLFSLISFCVPIFI